MARRQPFCRFALKIKIIMKQLITSLAVLLAVLFVMPANAYADVPTGEPAVSFKSTRGTREKESDRFVQVYLKSSVAGATFYVVVDGETTEYSMVKANYNYSKKITVSKPDVDVKVYGSTISFINFGNTDAYDVAIGEDGKKTITELRCEGDSITSLDFVNDMSALTYLYTSNNKKLKEININSDVLERVKLNAQPTVEKISLSGAKIYEFGMTTSLIKSIDLTKCPSLKTADLANSYELGAVTLSSNDVLEKLTVTNSKISELTVKDHPKFTTLAIGGNQNLASLNVSNCPLLNNVIANNCGLTSLSLKELPALKTLNISTNPFTSLELDLPALATLYCDATPLKSVDLSKLPVAKYLYVRNGVLETIKLSDDAITNTLTGLYIINNNFALVDIPARGPKMQPSSSAVQPYNYYAPQNMPQLPKNLNVGDKVDLSKYLYGNLNDGQKVDSKIQWVTKFDEELEEGVDYSVKDGVYTFLKAQEDSVMALVTNSEFVWFSLVKDAKGNVYDYRLKTNYTLVSTPSGVEGVESKNNVVVYSGTDGEINVAGADGEYVLVSDIAGRIVARGTVSSDKVLKVPTGGLYIVVVGDKSYKVAVK